MTTKFLGDSVSVRVSRWTVNAFAEKWPCCNLPDRAITFRFDLKSGDLLEVFGVSVPSMCCGELEALCEDAKKFAVEEIKKHYVCSNTNPQED
jgi:hypothetical protein